jgi:hypothetical protein
MIGNWIEKGVLLALSAVAIIDGLRIIVGHSSTFGAYQAGGYLILIGSLIGVLTVYAWIRGELGIHGSGDEKSGRGRGPKQVVLCLAILAGSSSLIPLLGYMLSTFLFFLAYFKWLGNYRLLRAMLLSASFGLLFSYIFAAAGMMLPQGPIPWP